MAVPAPIPPHRHGRTVTTRAQAGRRFLRGRAPRLLLAAVVLALVARATLSGPATWRDAAAVAAMVALFPFGEWAIHVHLLHLRPFRWRGREVELITTTAHRSHHEAPDDLGRILLGPGEALALVLGVVPLVVATGAVPLALLGVSPGRGAVLTAVVTAYALVVAYEWTHLLIHTAYRPRSRSFRAVHRGHRLHHFKNERYWNGVTSTVADRLLGTAPDHRDVPRSPTARSLDGPAT